jgi:dephospho-CoA kinase
VHAPEELRLARLMEKRGLTEAEARAIMDAQLPADAKRERADIVIDNDSTEGALVRRAVEVLAALRRRAEAL